MHPEPDFKRRFKSGFNPKMVSTNATRFQWQKNLQFIDFTSQLQFRELASVVLDCLASVRINFASLGLSEVGLRHKTLPTTFSKSRDQKYNYVQCVAGLLRITVVTAVWPGVGVKSCPNVSKSDLNNIHWN